jgi:hypothetical protein
MGRQLDDGERIALGLREDAIGTSLGSASTARETSGVGGTQPRERDALSTPGAGSGRSSSRAAKMVATGSAGRRRMAKSRASIDDWSNRWASSSRHRSGRSPAISESSDSVAAPGSPRSTAALLAPNAAMSASACAPGSACNRSSSLTNIADPGLPAQHQRSAAAVLRISHQAVDPRLFRGASNDHSRHATPGPFAVASTKHVTDHGDRCYFLAAVRETEEVVPVNVSTWVLPTGVTVGR